MTKIVCNLTLHVTLPEQFILCFRGRAVAHSLYQWTFPLSDKILKKIEIGKNILIDSLEEHPTFTKFAKFGCEML